jgi:ferredoxin-NADP reductase
VSTTLSATVHALRFEAEDITSIDLRPVDGDVFPPVEAGAHIDLQLPNGLLRRYSLVNPPGDQGRYLVAVLKDRASRGGSRWLHENLRIGLRLTISAPRNNFKLHEDASHSVLVAGGIGITPLLCMGRRLQQLGRSFELLVFARSRKSAAFVAEIEALGVPVHWHFDTEQGGPPDLKTLLAARPAKADTHYYACGPGVMLDSFEAICAALGYNNAHIERFTAMEVAAASDAKQTYTVELKRSGKVVTVTPEQTLLQALRSCGVEPNTSCEEGVCGSCETRVLGGTPDHRDSVLSASEQAANTVMMVCVGGCKSASLVLDL